MDIKPIKPGRYETAARKFVYDDRASNIYRKTNKENEDLKLRKMMNLLVDEGFPRIETHNDWFGAYDSTSLIGAAHVTSYADQYHPGLAYEAKGSSDYLPLLRSIHKNLQEGVFLDDFTVAKSSRGQGIGAQLLAFVENHYKDLGYRYIALGSTNRDATSFFKSQEYTDFGHVLPKRFYGGHYDLPMDKAERRYGHTYMAKYL